MVFGYHLGRGSGCLWGKYTLGSTNWWVSGESTIIQEHDIETNNLQSRFLKRILIRVTHIRHKTILQFPLPPKIQTLQTNKLININPHILPIERCTYIQNPNDITLTIQKTTINTKSWSRPYWLSIDKTKLVIK